MKTFPKHANRIRRRNGVSASGMRKIERFITNGERTVRRQFVAVERGTYAR